MKKVLFATTALVATASVAAAEVNFGGYGRFGLSYSEGAASETILESRFRLNIDGVVESDAGVKFEARVRMQADDNGHGGNGAAGTAGLNGARFSVSAAGLRVDVGNISGVFDGGAVLNFYGYEPGLTAFVGQYSTFTSSFDGYSSGGAGVNGVAVTYSNAGFTVAASYSADHGAGFDESSEFGVAYSFGDWKVGAAVGNANDGAAYDRDFWALTASGTVGPASVAVLVGDDDVNSDTAFGISASFEIGAATSVIASIAGGGVAGNAGSEEAYGIGVVHDLGSGVSIKGGVGNNTAGNTVADLGVQFNF